MTEIEIGKQLTELLREKLERLSIKDHEIGGSFDLVKSGLLNSLEFGKALDTGNFTTMNGLIKAFSSI
jgi:hypothetical protein